MAGKVCGIFDGGEDRACIGSVMSEFIRESRAYAALQVFCRSLLDADWEQSGGPLRLSGDLKLADLADVEMFDDARIFLTVLAEEDGAPATATGNLNRAFVRLMFDRLKLPEDYRESTLRVCKVINEGDVWPLHIVRAVSECAGLVYRRKKRFRVTKAGRMLLADEQAGALFRKLFIAYLQKFDLRYEFRFRDVPGIQQTMAIILWRLDAVARDWTPVRGLAPKVLLPAVLDQLHQAATYPYDTEEWILAGYVLRPLSRLGLIERRVAGEDSHVTEDDSIRITALWRRFICFPALFTNMRGFDN